MASSQTFLTEEIRPLLSDLVSLYDRCRSVCHGGVGCSVFLSQVIHRPTVMLMGINPAGAKENPDWEHVGEKQPGWVRDRVKASLKADIANGKEKTDKFLNLCRKCFVKEDWEEMFSTEPYSMVWSNLYPIATKTATRLDRLFEKVRTDEIHPKRICRETMARIVLKIQPKILLCAGKNVYKDLCKALKDVGAETNTIKQSVKGVYVCEAVKDGFTIHVVGFNRASSVGFWYDCRNKDKQQERALKDITHGIIRA